MKEIKQGDAVATIPDKLRNLVTKILRSLSGEKSRPLPGGVKLNSCDSIFVNRLDEKLKSLCKAPERKE